MNSEERESLLSVLDAMFDMDAVMEDITKMFDETKTWLSEPQKGNE